MRNAVMKQKSDFSSLRLCIFLCQSVILAQRNAILSAIDNPITYKTVIGHLSINK
jgi:hypothetical protein